MNKLMSPELSLELQAVNKAGDVSGVIPQSRPVT